MAPHDPLQTAALAGQAGHFIFLFLFFYIFFILLINHGETEIVPRQHIMAGLAPTTQYKIQRNGIQMKIVKKRHRSDPSALFFFDTCILVKRNEVVP
jgi:hypothetical protein